MKELFKKVRSFFGFIPQKAFNYFCAMAFVMIPVLVWREQFAKSPNDLAVFQWLWVVISYWIITPLWMLAIARRFGTAHTPIDGTYRGKDAIKAFVVTIIIWSLIFFLNK
ncbi:hypothetical protein [Ornithobacterium rhinotracheale]